MKRFALLPILFLLACEGSQVTSPAIPETTFKKAATCGFTFGPESSAETQFKGKQWLWDLTITFFTTPCADDLQVKTWFIYPDGKRKLVGVTSAVSSEDTNVGVRHDFTLRWVAPTDWSTFPEPWYPHFVTEVRSGNSLVGEFSILNH